VRDEESALDVASGAGVGVALMRRVPAEVLRSMDMTRFPWLHQSLREKVVPLLLNDASVADIHLRFNHIGGEGAQALAEMLKVNTTVMTIDLTWNQIGAEGARALAEMLKVNTTVTTIDLGYNSIGVKGAEALAEMLKVNTTVTEIDLGGNDIRAKGAEALAEMLKVNSTVITIDLGGNDIGAKGAQALKEARERPLLLKYTKWGDVNRSNFADHVAAKVSRCKTREDQDGLLHMELYELLREGMSGNIPPDQVGLALKDVTAKSSLKSDHMEDVVGDLLWLLGEEALADGKGKEGKVDLKSSMAAVFNEIIRSGVINSEVMKVRVSEEVLEAAGIIRDAFMQKGHLQRLRTSKTYSQNKFNLLREESEGYSKLVVALDKGFAVGAVSSKYVELLGNKVMCLIAYFSLDPNRVLDVMLDCLESVVDLPHAKLEHYMGLVRKFNATHLVQVMGFKLKGCENPPESLYKLVAVLCRHKALDIKDMYLYLWASDDKMRRDYSNHFDRVLKQIKQFNIRKTSTNGSSRRGDLQVGAVVEIHSLQKSPELNGVRGEVVKSQDLSTGRCEVKTATGKDLALKPVNLRLIRAPTEEDTMDAAPHTTTDDNNQKLHVTAALLQVGDWESAQHMLTVLAQLLPAAYRPVSAGLCKLLHAAIAPVYAVMMAVSGMDAVLKAVAVAPACIDVDDEAPQGPLVIREAKDLPVVLPLFRHLSVYVAHDAVLFMKLCRVLKEYMAQTATAGRDTDFVHEMLLALLGALVMLPNNASAASYIWECIKELPYLDRYWIYSELQWKVYVSHPELSFARAQCMEDLHKLYRATTMENVRRWKTSERWKMCERKRNLIGQMSHSQPLVVCESMLDQVQDKESMIDACKESLHYCSSLTLDVLSYLIVEELGGSLMLNKPLMDDKDTNLGRWLMRLSTFVAEMYAKHPRVEMQGLLQHVFNRLAADSIAELHVLRELISTMAGVKYDVDEVTKLDIESRAGGKRLRLAVEYPWPVESLFEKKLAEGEMGMGEEGGANQMKDYQSAKEEREEATKWLIHGLHTSGLALPMLVLIGQQITGCLFTKEALANERVKFSSWLHRQCQHTLLIFVDFLWRRMPGAEYTKKMPSPLDMVQKLQIEPTLALLMMRPALRWSEGNAGSIDLAKYANEMLTATPQNLKSTFPALYSCFWSLTLNDIYVPEACYAGQIDRLKKAIADLENSDRLDPKAKDKDIKKWKENLTLDLDKMEKEQKWLKDNRKRTLDRIEKDKNSLVLASKGTVKAMPQFFLQTCVFPRCVQSPEDAVYCAKFIKLLHSKKTPNLSTILIYDMIIGYFGPLVFSRTEQEANHLGMFLSEVLTTLNGWAKSESVYKAECEHFPGFTNSGSCDSDEKGKTNADLIDFQSYTKCVRNWHKKLTDAFCERLESTEGVEVHNALVILSRLLPGERYEEPVFPIHDIHHKDLKEHVAKMSDDSQHAFGKSISVKAKTIYGMMQKCEEQRRDRMGRFVIQDGLDRLRAPVMHHQQGNTCKLGNTCKQGNTCKLGNTCSPVGGAAPALDMTSIPDISKALFDLHEDSQTEALGSLGSRARLGSLGAIGVEGAQALAEILEVNTTVTDINLGCNDIGAGGAQALAEMLKVNSTVTTINLEMNGIGDDGAQALAEMFKFNTTVTDINLGGNNICAEGVQALAEALHVNGLCFLQNKQRVRAFAACAKETSLDLRHNYLPALPTAVLALAQLTALDASDNRLTSLPGEELVRALPALEALEVSNNCLETLPIEALLNLPALKKLDCKGNARLTIPPPEIAQQGGAAVVTYVREAYSADTGSINRDIELIMIGKGESGKTSTVKAMMAADDRAEPIREDARTVGIDLKRWDLAAEAEGLVFQIKDLAGQAVYAMTNQFFLVRRAIFVFVWRVLRPADVAASADEFEREVTAMVLTWLDAVHFRVPGAQVVLVATHIDCAAPAEVDEQCRLVKAVVERKLREWAEHEAATGVLAMAVWGGGESVRVNCLEGTGVQALRACLIDMAHQLPWWREGVPKSYLTLKAAIAERQQESAWLTPAEYVQMARECGVTGVHLGIATKFLHDCAALKYFGKHPIDGPQPQGAVLDSVFIDAKWIIDALKGLIRHSRDALHEFFGTHALLPRKERKTWLRRVKRVAVYGLLHVDLVPFLWPDASQHDGAPLSKRYWAWAMGRAEGELWTRPVAATAADYDRIMSLLAGCDIVHRVSRDEFLVPALLAETQKKLDARAFSSPDFAACKYVLTVPGLPESFMHRLLVKLRRHYQHMDFTGTAAALYDRGLKLQLFVTATTLTVYASTRRQLAQVQQYLRDLCVFFPGVHSLRGGVARAGLDGEESVVGRGDEPIQVSMIEAAGWIGWKWEMVGEADWRDWRGRGTEIKNQKFAQALAVKKEFTNDELAAYQVFNLSASSYIKVGDIYFKPDKPEPIAEQIRAAILAADGKDQAQDDVLRITPPSRSEWTDTSQMRVVIVVIDPRLAADSTAVQQFRAAVARGLVLIPVIAPGYNIQDYSRWWPDDLPELRQYALFVDLRAEEEWPQKVEGELLRQINKFLSEWRGEVPDPAAFAEAADRVVCAQCSDEGMDVPHAFSRCACEEQLTKWRVQARADAAADGGAAREPPQLTCSRGHVVDLEDALSQPPLLQALPCPMCLKRGMSPPYAFNREECLLYFTEGALKGAREGVVQCPFCVVFIRILDIVVPEVFLSYNWGEKDAATGTYSTQEIVRSVRFPIEDGADVVTWFDVGGGMGAGQSAAAEMEQGVAKSTVVIIFLSDAYCSSGNCMREFLHTVRHSKYIIPVLVPGWTGAGAEDTTWWLHAHSCSDCKDPDTGAAFSWSTLGRFAPVDLRIAGAGDARRGRALEAAEVEIVRRIQMRFHRSKHLNH